MYATLKPRNRTPIPTPLSLSNPPYLTLCRREGDQKFLTQDIFQTQIHNFSGPIIFLDPKCFWTQHSFGPKIFWNLIFFWPNIFFEPNFFWTKFFLNQNYFRPKSFSDPKFYLTQNFFQIFLGPKIFWTKIFLTQFFLDPIYFWI